MTKLNSTEIADKLLEAEIQLDDNAIFDEIAKLFHGGVVRAWMDADRITIFRELPDNEKLEALIAGTLTALVGIGFSGILETEGRDDLMSYIIDDCMPLARKLVERESTP
jgi:hypothetical protein